MLNRIPRSLVQILLLGVLVLPVGCGMNLTWGEFCSTPTNSPACVTVDPAP